MLPQHSDDVADAPASSLSWRLRLLAWLIMGALVLGVGELAVRLVVPEARLLPIGEIHVAAQDRALWSNPYSLWEPRRGTYHDGGSVVYVNHLGFRGPAGMTVEKPAGTFRVLVTGDSSVYGFGVADDEMFSRRLELLLAARFPSRRIEVVNGAVPGWSTLQSLHMLRTKGLKMQPDLLIVGNLFSDNNYDNFVDKEIFEELEGQRRMYELCVRLDRVRLFRAGRTLYAMLRPPKVMPPRQVRMADRSTGFSGRRRVPLQDYAENLRAMVAETAAVGGLTAFLMLANREDLRPPSIPFPWEPYREAMKKIAEESRSVVADYPRVARAHAAEGGDALFLDRMHPTARGHQLMAETMLEALIGFDGFMTRMGTGGKAGP